MCWVSKHSVSQEFTYMYMYPTACKVVRPDSVWRIPGNETPQCPTTACIQDIKSSFQLVRPLGVPFPLLEATLCWKRLSQQEITLETRPIFVQGWIIYANFDDAYATFSDIAYYCVEGSAIIKSSHCFASKDEHVHCRSLQSATAKLISHATF